MTNASSLTPAKLSSLDSFSCRKTLRVDGRDYLYFSLPEAERHGLNGLSRLPVSLKVLLENLLRHEDGRSVTKDDLLSLAKRDAHAGEISFRPARVLMQDFTGVPAIVDLASMRDAMRSLGGDPETINPLIPVDLVIDHSVMVDAFARPDAFLHNVQMEYGRNQERYAFLKWGRSAFRNFRVIPPGAGICHQVNLEYLARTVWTRNVLLDQGEALLAYPDTLVGTDSHTTMVNGLGVLGWGVGGIEAEAAMLDQPISMLIPQVVGLELTGTLGKNITATDLVLTITELLRKEGVVGKFVEFFGEGVRTLSLEDRATIANMAPEYGATCGFFPVDDETLRYLRDTGRTAEQIRLIEAYTNAQSLFHHPETASQTLFDTRLSLDISSVVPSMAGPKRPQDRVPLSSVPNSFRHALAHEYHQADNAFSIQNDRDNDESGSQRPLRHGDVVIAAITSCTNTSNPSVMIAAGLLARNAITKGLSVKPWVKTSFAPGSRVVTEYLARSGLSRYLDQLGFHLVGYGCTTCIGNSGPLPEHISQAIRENDLATVSVLSGNRNFEGRINQDVKANYLASPPLVVAYALTGTILTDLSQSPLGFDSHGQPVFLADIWPDHDEISSILRQNIVSTLFSEQYRNIFDGDDFWRKIDVSHSQTFHWQDDSTYIRRPPYFDGVRLQPDPVTDIRDARIIALFLDSITTDHISPAGGIASDSPAGLYLREQGIQPTDFNSYGARRGNDCVMIRGTFANIRLKNRILDGVEGGLTKHFPSGETMPIYDAAMRYAAEGHPLVVMAGKEYGSGSSRDWAAKGVRLLGVRAVIAQSFERIHRSNLIGMGILPLVFKDGISWESLGIRGDELVTISGLNDTLRPRAHLTANIRFADGTHKEIPLLSRIDTLDEVEYFRHGGILHYTLRQLAAADTPPSTPKSTSSPSCAQVLRRPSSCGGV